MVVGTSGAIPGQPYHVKIEFTPDIGDNLTVKSLGVWLPQGFSYADNCSLKFDGSSVPYYPDSENTTDINGGQTVVWKYDWPYPLFTDFPGVDPLAETMSLDFTFSYTPPAEYPNRLPTAIAWITTDMNIGSLGYANPNDVRISWDVDTRIYEITSNAGETFIQAYSSKCELRQMGDAMSGDYVAIGNSLMANDDPMNDNYRETWYTPSSVTLSSIPSDADVVAAYIYWAGWRNEASKVYLIEDSCTNMDTYWTYSSPTSWSVEGNEYKGHYQSGGEAARLLTLNTQDLSSYEPGSILLTWEQNSEIDGFSDYCNNLNNWDNGGAWSEQSNRFRGRSGTPNGDPVRRLSLKTGTVDLEGYASGSITVSWDQWENDGDLGADEGLDFAFSSDNGSNWSANIPAFRNDISGVDNHSYTVPDAYLTNGFKIRFEIVGFTGFSYCYIDNIEIEGSTGLSSSDGLDFAFWDDDASTWGNYYQAFRGNLSPAEEFTFTVPREYAHGNFRFRYKVVGCDEYGENICIDNFKLINLPIDNEIFFKIGNGPGEYSGNITSERSYVMLNYLGTDYGFSYACTRDVSSLVKTYPIDAGETHHTGNAIYTVDGIEADNGRYPWSYDDSHFAFAGWSLIIVYASPTTAGHYLYIRDDNFAFHPGTGISLDFDQDGSPGGDITNFVVPEPLKDQYGTVNETIAARLTCFIVEGDNWVSPDSITITGQQSAASKDLSNPQSPVTNVWNGKSYPGTFKEGVDIDTFEVLWADNILTPGDNILHVDMVSTPDCWNLVYFIISVRSETVTGGTSHYVIYN